MGSKASRLGSGASQQCHKDRGQEDARQDATEKGGKEDSQDNHRDNGDPRDPQPQLQNLQLHPTPINHEPFSNYYHLREGNVAVRKADSQRVRLQSFPKNYLEEFEQAGFHREVSIRKELRHPSIASLFDVFDDGDSFLLVTELVEGEELLDPYKVRSEAEVAQILHQLVSAVAYLHESGINYAYLQRENVLVAGESIKIANFGSISYRYDFPCGKSKTRPDPIAPETLESDIRTRESDMWAIGVMLFVLFCGSHPFEDVGLRHYLPRYFRNIMETNFSFEAPEWNSVSDDAKKLVQSLLRKDPEQRLSAAQVLEHHWLLENVFSSIKPAKKG